jgi:bacteriocin-like protein
MKQGPRRSKAETIAGSAKKQNELSDAELDNVIGGVSFLTGPLTRQLDVAAWVHPGGADASGFIMKDTVIVRTGR